MVDAGDPYLSRPLDSLPGVARTISPPGQNSRSAWRMRALASEVEATGQAGAGLSSARRVFQQRLHALVQGLVAQGA